MMVITAFQRATDTTNSSVSNDNNSNGDQDVTDFHSMIPFFGNKNKQNNETELSHL